MKKSKIVLNLVLIIVLLFGFTGCSTSVNKPIDANQALADEVGKSDQILEEGSLYDFEVTLNGVDYVLPCPFSELAANGWTIENGDSTLVGWGEIEYYMLTHNGNNDIYIDFQNNTDEDIPLTQCDISAINFDSIDEKSGTTVQIFRNIKLGSSYEDVIAAYGEPTDEESDDIYTTITYDTSLDAYVELGFDLDTKELEVIYVDNSSGYNMRNKAIMEQPLPEIIANYKTPETLGDDLKSFNVNYGGDIISLPVPVATMVENGWHIFYDAEEMIDPQSYISDVTLIKDQYTITVRVENHLDAEAPVYHCFVIGLESYVIGPDVSIELPKGITRHSTIDEVIAAYGEADQVEEGSMTTEYTYGADWNRHTFSVDNDTKEILQIIVDNEQTE